MIWHIPVDILYMFRFQEVFTDTRISQSLLHLPHVPTLILQAVITAHANVKFLLMQEKNMQKQGLIHVKFNHDEC